MSAPVETSSPVREIRERIAGLLEPLGVNTYDVLPDHVDPPVIAIGLPSISLSRSTPNLIVLGVEVEVVGERADFASAQLRLDDLAWSVWSTLRSSGNGVWTVEGLPRSIFVANQSFPGFVVSVEAVLPCPS